MSLVSLPTPLAWPIQIPGNANFFAYGNLVIDAAGEKAAQIWNVTKAGDISAIWFRTINVATGDTVDARVETVSATDGNPTGTLWGTNTNGSVVIAAADDNKMFKATLTAAATVAVGDQIALVVANGAGGGNMQITTAPTNLFYRGHSEYAVHYTTAWTKQAQDLSIALEYSDGTVVLPGGSVLAGDGAGAVGTNRSISSGQQAGAYLTVPVAGRICAVKSIIAGSSTRGNVQYKIYRSTDLTNAAAQSAVIDKDVVYQQFDYNPLTYPLTSPLTVAAGDLLYVVLEASAAAVNLRYLTSNSGDEEVLPGHATFYTAHRAGTTGAFTTAVNEYPLIQIVMDQIDNGLGGGRASHQIGI